MGSDQGQHDWSRELAVNKEAARMFSRVVSPTHRKIVHWGLRIRSGKPPSAACFSKTRAISPKRARWSFDPEQATCKRCMAYLAGVR
jgi:hypothetical protein